MEDEDEYEDSAALNDGPRKKEPKSSILWRWFWEGWNGVLFTGWPWEDTAIEWHLTERWSLNTDPEDYV